MIYFSFDYRSPLRRIAYGKLASDKFLLILTIGSIISIIIGRIDPLPGKVLPFIEKIYFSFSCLFLVYFIIAFLVSFLKKEGEDNNSVIGNLFDDPIKNFDEDRLGRKDFVERISHFIEEHESDGYSIGLIGEWGSGKTSIINLIKKTIPDNFVKIDFNPWYFGENNHGIVKNFLSTLANELDDKTSRTLKKQLRLYGDVLSSISIRSSSLTLNFKDLIERLSPKESQSLDVLKADIEKSLTEVENPICIFIDDLDRLSPEEVQMIFKLVRLIADFKGIIYILCMDESVILESLQGMYKDSIDQNDINSAKRYMEKFIQVPIYLPRTDNTKFGKVAWEKIVGILSKLDITVYDLNESEFIERINHLNFNLRTLKRFLTTFELYMGLLKNEVDVRDLIYLLMIKSKDSKLHDYIYTHSSLFLSRKALEKDQEMKRIFPDYLTYKEILEDILPLSSALWDENFKSNNVNLNKNLKLTNVKFFNRYFQYALPESEAQFKDIELFLYSLTELEDETETMKVYFEISHKYEAEYILNRIRSYINYLDNEKVLDKILTIARIRLFHAYSINSEISDQETVALEGLVNEVFINHPSKILNFINDETLIYIVRKHETLVELINEESDKLEFYNSLKNLLYRNFEIELSLKYSLKDSSRLLRMWSELEEDSSRIKDRIAGWLVNEKVLNDVLSYALSENIKVLLNDYVKNIYYYIECIKLTDILPMDVVRGLLISEENLPNSVKELSSYSDEEDWYLKLFSFAYANFYNFGYENISNINKSFEVTSTYWSYYEKLYNYSYDEANPQKDEFDNKFRDFNIL